MESSKSYTAVLLATCRMDIAFVNFASTNAIKDTLLFFLRMTWKATAIVVSKAHEAKDLVTCSKVNSKFDLFLHCI